MRVRSLPDRDGCAQRGDLREREVNEDDPSLDHMQSEIGVNAGDDQARRNRRREELKDVQVHSGYFPVTAFNVEASVFTL